MHPVLLHYCCACTLTLTLAIDSLRLRNTACPLLSSTILESTGWPFTLIYTCDQERREENYRKGGKEIGEKRTWAERREGQDGETVMT